MTSETTNTAAEREPMTLYELGELYASHDYAGADEDAVRAEDTGALRLALADFCYRGIDGYGYNGPNADCYQRITLAMRRELARRGVRIPAGAAFASAA